MGELLDFKERGNFDFFKFSAYSGNSAEFQRILKSKCEHVLEYAHATVQDMCLLGYNLKELKEGGTWQWVKNPETSGCFEGGQFAEFCEYAFGFSKTKTSDLLRLAQFVKISGTKNGFLSEQYQGYNTSQLVELASVMDGQRHYFTPDMPVSEMRLVKQYIDSGKIWDDQVAARRCGVEFDAVESAKAWKENKSKKSSPAPSLSPDVIPGQVNFEELGEEVFENPTSDLATDCESEIEREYGAEREEIERDFSHTFAEEERRETFGSEDDGFNSHFDTECDDFDSWLENQPEGTFVQGGGIDEDIEENANYRIGGNPYSKEEYIAKNPTSDLAEDSEADKYTFGARARVREFLSNYEKWPLRCGYAFLDPTYCYALRNGAFIYGFAYNSFVNVQEGTTEKRVLYFLQEKGDFGAVEISKEQFEKYCAENKQEL